MEKDQRVTFSGAAEKHKKRPICRAGFIAKSYQIFFSNTSKNSSEENILTPSALRLQRSPPLFIFFPGRWRLLSVAIAFTLADQASPL